MAETMTIADICIFVGVGVGYGCDPSFPASTQKTFEVT